MAPAGSEKERKRKRDAPNGDSSSKQRSVEAAKGDIKLIHTSSSGQQLSYPVIASLPGIQLKSLQFNAYTKSYPKSNAAAQPAPSSHSILLHSSGHPNLDYTAGAPPSQDTEHYLGVFDPTINSLQIIPAYAATIRSTLRSEIADVQKASAKQSRAAQRQALGMEFGTKKAKRAIASKTVNAITSETGKGVEAAVMGTVNETSTALPDRTELEEALLKAKPIPRPNSETDRIEEVYHIDKLMPKAVAREMTVKEWQDKANANEAIEFTSRFVANRVQTLAKSENVTKLRALKYMLLLLDFVAALSPARGGRKLPKRDVLKEKMPDWPETVVDGVRKRFAEGGELNKWHFDNLMTHMAAISLYIDDYRTDTYDLREDLRLESKPMLQYFHELGCRIRSLTEKEYAEFRIVNKAQGAQRKVALLKLPLDFPKVRNPPKRR